MLVGKRELSLLLRILHVVCGVEHTQNVVTLLTKLCISAAQRESLTRRYQPWKLYRLLPVWLQKMIRGGGYQLFAGNCLAALRCSLAAQEAEPQRTKYPSNVYYAIGGQLPGKSVMRAHKSDCQVLSEPKWASHVSSSTQLAS